MKNKKVISAILIITIITLFTTGCGKEAEVKNGSKVAVSVNEAKYSATDYYNKIKENNISVLIDMIDKSIFDKKYKEAESQEEKESIDKQIEQMKSYAGNDDESYKNIMQQYFGVDNEEDLRKKLGLDYRRNKAVEEYVTNHLTDKEIQKYYDESITGEIKASHILIPVNVTSETSTEDKEKAEKKAEKKAKEIIKKLNKGEDFAKLAKKESKDEGTASSGGDLGYFQPADMTEAFANAVKELKVKEYTKEPVKTEYGYHIILKTGEKDKPKLKEVKKDIKEKLKTQKLQNSSTLYYETLIKVREDSKIKWNDSTLKRAYNNYMDKLIANAKKNSTSTNQKKE